MSPQIIDVEVVNDNVPPKLVPAIPMSIVCPHCKQETGFTKEHILEMTILDDIKCPSCDDVIYSSKPQKNTYCNWPTSSSIGSHYDYDY